MKSRKNNRLKKHKKKTYKKSYKKTFKKKSYKKKGGVGPDSCDICCEKIDNENHFKLNKSGSCQLYYYFKDGNYYRYRNGTNKCVKKHLFRYKKGRTVLCPDQKLLKQKDIEEQEIKKAREASEERKREEKKKQKQQELEEAKLEHQQKLAKQLELANQGKLNNRTVRISKKSSNNSSKKSTNNNLKKSSSNSSNNSSNENVTIKDPRFDNVTRDDGF